MLANAYYAEAEVTLKDNIKLLKSDKIYTNIDQANIYYINKQNLDKIFMGFMRIEITCTYCNTVFISKISLYKHLKRYYC